MKAEREDFQKGSRGPKNVGRGDREGQWDRGGKKSRMLHMYKKNVIMKAIILYADIKKWKKILTFWIGMRGN